MRTLVTKVTKVRGYGWYCPYCQEHKDIEKVSVVKLVGSPYMTMICDDCTTEVVDCFLEQEKDCDNCSDRFRCLTRSDAIAEKSLKLVKGHEIKILPERKDTRAIEYGVRSYTGIYNTKLETDETFCMYPKRDDCNHSWMRWNYHGQAYRRCVNMKYDKEKQEWYCQYGRAKRGEV